MTTSMQMFGNFKIPEKTPEEWAEWNAMLEREEQEKKAQEAYQRLKDAHIPREYENATDLLPEVKEWAQNPTVGLLLTGESGRGKTYQASGALKEITRTNRALFTTFDEIKHDCKDCFKDYRRESDVIRDYVFPYCLLIDDMGKEQVTEWSLPILFEIIKKRGEKLRPTIITTNYSGKELQKRLTVNGEIVTAKALISRMSAYKIIKMDGKDRRKSIMI